MPDKHAERTGKKPAGKGHSPHSSMRNFDQPILLKGRPSLRRPDIARTFQAELRVIPRRHLAQIVKELKNEQHEQKQEEREGARVSGCFATTSDRLNKLSRTTQKVRYRKARCVVAK